MFEKPLIQNIVIVLLLLIFFGLGYWVWNNGVKSSQSKAVVKDVQAISQGFDYFHKDQNRYPTTGEFEDANLMRGYISGFPPQSFPSELCEKTYDYFSAGPQTYELRFCLSKSVGNFQPGWNVIKK